MRDMSIARPPRGHADVGTGVGVLDRRGRDPGRRRSRERTEPVGHHPRDRLHAVHDPSAAPGDGGARPARLRRRRAGITSGRGSSAWPNRALRELPLRDLAHPALERLQRVDGRERAALRSLRWTSGSASTPSSPRASFGRSSPSAPRFRSPRDPQGRSSLPGQRRPTATGSRRTSNRRRVRDSTSRSSPAGDADGPRASANEKQGWRRSARPIVGHTRRPGRRRLGLGTRVTAGSRRREAIRADGDVGRA